MFSKVFIISRRAYEQDDFDYGTYEPVLCTLNANNADKTFKNIYKSVLLDAESSNITCTDFSFEYKRKNWCYQYKLEEFELDKFQSKFKDLSK